MSILIEPALSALFEGVFQKIGSREFFNFARHHQVEAEINKWVTMLRTLFAVLEDAEQKQLASQAVKVWLEDLQHLAYDVEDVLDEFNYEMLRREVKGNDQSCTSMIGNIAPVFISAHTPKALLFNSKLASKLHKITTRLQEITERKRLLDLLENTGVVASRRGWSRPPSSSVPNEPIFIGRDEEKSRLIELVKRHEHGDPRIGIIPIKGMGGLGKTSLARSVYNEEAVRGIFPVRVWVCVSQDYDVTQITRGILEAVTSQHCDFRELSLIQAKLHEALSGKKFLLVLDDLWNKNYGDWDVLRSPLMHGAIGSKVIITTRLAEVADMVRNVKYETLMRMSDDECWSIFCSHAFDWNENSPTNSRFEEIGKKIVKKCLGLPLAAMSLGGLLRSKEREEDWEFILNRSWSFRDGTVDILSVLRMSYYDLPSHLKRCFAYCAIFPEDFEFEEDALVFLWMAEGLIHARQMGGDEKHMEDLGHDYFRDLVSRSFFLPSNRNEYPYPSSFPRESPYVIHDLVRDLAEEVASKTCYRVEKDTDSPTDVIRQRARHITYARGWMREFEFLGKMQVIRTILPMPLDKWAYYGSTVPQHAVTALLSKIRYLRVLSFNGYKISVLPEFIGKLKHLRYLDLSATNVRSLPTSTTSLYNLHTLILIGCHMLKMLPRDMWKLINLYHLDITGTYLYELPPGITELKNLGRLSNFIVGKGRDSGLTSLRNLKFLRGELRISKLENATSAEDARLAALRDKNNLESLSLEWSAKPSNEESHGSVVEELQPHKDLKRLTIWNCRGASIPSWMVKLTMLRQVDIQNCPKMSGSLPLAMTSLKHLVISGCPLLVVKLPRLPELSLLRISDCKEVDCAEDTNFDSLNEVTLSCIENVTSLVRKKVVEVVKHVKSLLLIGANNPSSYSHSKIFPLWKLENLPFVTSLMSDGDGGQTEHVLAQIKVEHLYLSCFESLDKLPQWVFNATCLRKLEIKDCGELMSIASGGKLPSGLEELVVVNCSKLEIIAERLNNEMKSFKLLEIRGCPSLKKLPDGMHGLTSLQELMVTDCQGLDPIPGGSLPTTLTRLEFANNNSVKPLLEWGLHRLPCLSDLFLGGCPGAVSFLPEEIGMMLPQSLVVLRIDDFQDLEYLTSSGFQDLGSLEYFTVENCPKLATFPDGGLPPSLRDLRIYGCPLLKKNCLGRGWSSISRIPTVFIDGKLVSKSGEMLPGFRPEKKSCVPWFG